MASRKVPNDSVPAQLPESLQAALDDGWRIVEQLSTWEFDSGCQREGFIFLRKPGTEENDAGQITVPFLALYSARRPYFTFEDDERPAPRSEARPRAKR